MDQEDVDRVLSNLWDQNPEEVLSWVSTMQKTQRTLKRAEKEISELEKAKVLR